MTEINYYSLKKYIVKTAGTEDFDNITEMYIRLYCYGASELTCEWIKYDLQVSKDGLAWLAELVEEARKDYTTFDILKKYYQDEEEDVYWAEEQLDLIEMIGKENWLVQQL